VTPRYHNPLRVRGGKEIISGHWGPLNETDVFENGTINYANLKRKGEDVDPTELSYQSL